MVRMSLSYDYECRSYIHSHMGVSRLWGFDLILNVRIDMTRNVRIYITANARIYITSNVRM